MSQFADFITQHEIKPEDLVSISAALERHDRTDREQMVKRAAARRAKKSYDELDAKKPEGLGRGLSLDVARRAIDGKPLPRVARQKLLRAVNARLRSLKKDEVDTKALFGDARARKGKPPQKKR